MNRLVISHKNCKDGTAAAWCAWHKFKDSARYLQMNYGENIDLQCFIDKEVYILDFSFKRDFCLKIKEVAKSLLILDHHATAEKELEGLDFAKFDMNKSGAVLAWEHFNPSEAVPMFIKYIDDADRWAWELPSSREIAAGSSLYNNTIEDFEKLSNASFNELYEKGLMVAQYIELYICQMMPNFINVVLSNAFGKFAGMNVPVINCPYWSISRLLNNKIVKEKCPLAIGYFKRGDGKWQYSLRSSKDFDCSEIAKIFNGGGHKSASGMESTELLF